MATSNQIKHYSDLGRKYLPGDDKPLIPPYGPFTVSDTAPLQGDGEPGRDGDRFSTTQQKERKWWT